MRGAHGQTAGRVRGSSGRRGGRTAQHALVVDHRGAHAPRLAGHRVPAGWDGGWVGGWVDGRADGHFLWWWVGGWMGEHAATCRERGTGSRSRRQGSTAAPRAASRHHPARPQGGGSLRVAGKGVDAQQGEAALHRLVQQAAQRGGARQARLRQLRVEEAGGARARLHKLGPAGGGRGEGRGGGRGGGESQAVARTALLGSRQTHERCARAARPPHRQSGLLRASLVGAGGVDVAAQAVAALHARNELAALHLHQLEGGWVGGHGT